MRPPLKERIKWTVGEWLAATPLRRWALQYDGLAPAGLRYVNRVNGHAVVIAR